MTTPDFPALLLDSYNVALGPFVEDFFTGQAPFTAYGVAVAVLGLVALSRWARRKA